MQENAKHTKIMYNVLHGKIYIEIYNKKTNNDGSEIIEIHHNFLLW